jgi:hypothetical protein
VDKENHAQFWMRCSLTPQGFPTTNMDFLKAPRI